MFPYVTRDATRTATSYAQSFPLVWCFATHLSCSHAHKLWRLERDAAAFGQLRVVDVKKVLRGIAASRPNKPKWYVGGRQSVVSTSSWECGIARRRPPDRVWLVSGNYNYAYLYLYKKYKRHYKPLVYRTRLILVPFLCIKIPIHLTLRWQILSNMQCSRRERLSSTGSVFSTQLALAKTMRHRAHCLALHNLAAEPCLAILFQPKLNNDKSSLDLVLSCTYDILRQRGRFSWL